MYSSAVMERADIILCFTFACLLFCLSVKSCPCISALIASVCALSSQQLGTIKCFSGLAAKPPLRLFRFNSHFIMPCRFSLCGWAPCTCLEFNACVFVQHQIKCTYILPKTTFCSCKKNIFPCLFYSKMTLLWSLKPNFIILSDI